MKLRALPCRVSVVFLVLAIEQRRCSTSHLRSKLLCLTIHGKRVLPLLENLLQATDVLLEKTVFSAILITFGRCEMKAGLKRCIYNRCELQESTHDLCIQKRLEKYGCSTATNCRCAQLCANLASKWTR